MFQAGSHAQSLNATMPAKQELTVRAVISFTASPATSVPNAIYWTKRRLMERFQGHFYNISSKNKKFAIGHHFNMPDHKVISDVQIHIVDFIHQHPEHPQSLSLRRKIEWNWQYRMLSNAPQGLNIQD